MALYQVYLLECSDGSYYCGISSNVTRRIKEHNRGKGAKYTRSRLPVSLLYSSGSMTKSKALKFEYQVKQQSRSQKLRYLIEIG